MPLLNAGAMIRELRQSHGLTQEKLAEGICSRETVVKLENGERKADWFIIRNLFMRLGIDPDTYYNELASENDIYILKKRDECAAYFNTGKWEKLKSAIENLERDKRFLQGGRKGRGYALLIRYKAHLYASDPYKNFQKALGYYLETLKITRPNFDIDEIPNYLLSYDETIILNCLANAFSYSGEDGGDVKALEIWQNMRINYEKSQLTHIRGKNENYLLILGNIAKQLLLAERFEACLQILEKSLPMAFEKANARLILTNLWRKAWCLLNLDRKAEGDELLKKYFMLAYVLEGKTRVTDDEINQCKKDYEDKFNGQLDLSIAW